MERPLMPNTDSDVASGQALKRLKLARTALTTITTGDTIDSTLPIARVTTGSNRTGILVKAGEEDGQILIISNQGAGTLVFASAATSLVLDGANITVPATRCAILIWDAGIANWVAQEGTA